MSDISNYIDVPVETNAKEIATEALVYLKTAIPNYTPREGQLDVAIIEAVAASIAENRDIASRVPKSIFRFFGKSVFNVPAVDAAYATTYSTWTAVDSRGYTIPAKTLVGFQLAFDTFAYFQTVDTVSIAAGQTSTLPGEVELRAVAPGTAYNGIAAGPVQLAEALVWVTSVTSTQATSGGEDAETDDEYLDRLRALARTMAPRPIRPEDFATLALGIPGVDRAVAIDGYNPITDTYNNERTVAVALADPSGNPVSSSVAEAVKRYLESLREVNFVVNTIEPGYETVNVEAVLKAQEGYDPDDVRAAATAAVRNYLNPATWDWENVVRHNELISLLDQVEGVRYVDVLTTPADNIILNSVADLVRAGNVNIIVEPS